MIQQIKQSTVNCLHDTDGSNNICKKIMKKKLKEKEKGAKCTCMTGVNCCVIGNVLSGI